jgi:pimeloyl-ACP methyl ester carboxylesterase
MSLAHRLLRKPFFGRFEAPWRMPEREKDRGWQRVTIPSPTGASLAGLVGEADAEAAGVLVLAHPMGKAAKGFWLRYGHAELFRRAGFHVLAFDFNGFGESEGRSFDYPSDALAAGRFAQAHFPQLPVALVGASFGAGWGLCSMAREGSPYRAAVLEGVFPTLPDFWRHYPVAHAFLRASQLVWPKMEREMRPERHAAGIVGNPDVLIIHGESDPFTPPEHGERVRRAMDGRARAELWVLPDVEHTFAYRDQKEAYAARVVPFLRRALGED